MAIIWHCQKIKPERQLSKTRRGLDGVAQSARGTMEPPDVTPSPRGILRPSGSFKKRQLERLMLEEAGEASALIVAQGGGSASVQRTTESIDGRRTVLHGAGRGGGGAVR